MLNFKRIKNIIAIPNICSNYCRRFYFMDIKSKAFEEFVTKIVDEELLKDENYKLLTLKNIENFNAILSVLDERDYDILFQYEKAVSEINDIYQKALIGIVLNVK